MAILDAEQLRNVYQLAVDSGLSEPDRRDALLAGLPSSFLAGLPRKSRPSLQLESDLRELNGLKYLIDLDEPPLLVWLKNAGQLSQPRPEAAKLQAYCQAARHPSLNKVGATEQRTSLRETGRRRLLASALAALFLGAIGTSWIASEVLGLDQVGNFFGLGADDDVEPGEMDRPIRSAVDDDEIAVRNRAYWEAHEFTASSPGRSAPGSPAIETSLRSETKRARKAPRPSPSCGDSTRRAIAGKGYGDVGAVRRIAEHSRGVVVGQPIRVSRAQMWRALSPDNSDVYDVVSLGDDMLVAMRSQEGWGRLRAGITHGADEPNLIPDTQEAPVASGQGDVLPAGSATNVVTRGEGDELAVGSNPGMAVGPAVPPSEPPPTSTYPGEQASLPAAGRESDQLSEGPDDFFWVTPIVGDGSPGLGLPDDCTACHEMFDGGFDGVVLRVQVAM